MKRTVAILVLAIFSPAAFAQYVPWVWVHAANQFPTKEQALADVHSGSPSAVVLTEDAGITAMSATEAQYKYVAPPQSITQNPWQYANPLTGIGYVSSEEEAVPLLESFWAASYGSCVASSTATPTSDWVTTNLAAYGSLGDSRSYTDVVVSTNAPNCFTGSLSFSTGLSRIRTFTCPTFYTATTTAPYCADSSFDYIETVPCPCAAGSPTPSTHVGNPCDVSTGEKFQTEADYSGPALAFTRYYHSATLESSHTLGIGWTHNFAAYLILYQGNPAGLERPDGHHDPLVNINGVYVSQSGSSIHVQQSGSNWVAFLGDGSQELYSGTNGALLQLVSAAGQITTLNYNPDGTLASVVGPFGHSLQFAYTNGFLTQVSDPAGLPITYAYDGNNNLASVTYQDGKSRIYAYENSSFPNNLTGITDESSVRYATYGYDSIGRAISSTHVGGADTVNITYAINGNTANAIVTDGIGGTTDYTFSYASLPRVTSLSHNGLTTSYVIPSASQDAQQRPTQMTDPNGNVSGYSYDNDHMTSEAQAEGTPIARSASYQYLSTTSALPTLTTEPLKQTSYTYYSGTNLVQTKTVTDTSVSPNVSRTWSYTYDSYGRMLTAQGPRTDLSSTTTYTYYTCTSGVQCGQVESTTDAAGNVTTFNSYNAHGQPLTITDPNGVVTTLAYDARLRLSSRSTAGETTGFAYYPTGLLQTVTNSDGSTIANTYDGAHRLTQVQDGAGNSIQYTLDSMGNRTAESRFDPSNTLSMSLSRAYNSLNELSEQIGSAGTSAVTTSFSYDSNGNQTATNAPLNRNTSNAYDALNRLSHVTDPGNGVTSFAYDANDNLTSVHDPIGLTTGYLYDGFGDLLQLASPATGTTSNTYDLAGNLKTSLDARGISATYTYDALNRMAEVSYPDQTITYQYDVGTNGKGHMTSASDSLHSMGWQYDALGRIVTKRQSVAGVTQSVSYAYTNSDLTTLTTASGQSIAFAYSNHQVTAITVNGTSLLSALSYEPFGPVRGWTWGNGTTETRTHDTDGNPSLISALESTNYTLDSAFRIVGISNTTNTALSWTYGYDGLDRLTSASGNGASLGFSYDGDGNRLSSTGRAAPRYSAAYLVPSFNGRNRMVSVSGGGAPTSYVYNAVGQRIEKVTANPLLYVYDEAGHLMGEYTSNGTLVEETVWLGDLSVATLRPDPSGGIDIFYVHSDHLNTPKMVTRPADNAVMWRWDQDPFGTATPNQNPSGVGTFVYNLRFPGQYYDAETGLNYNMARDFDPSTGRFVESDPTGLMGGIDTYDYVANRPTMATDPWGLFLCDDWKWMAFDWLTGLGDRNRTYGAESDQVTRLKNLPAVNWARQRYLQKNGDPKPNGCCNFSQLQPVTNVKSSFGIAGFIQATMQGNCAWHFVGSFRLDVTPVSCSQARFTITNNSSFTSFSDKFGPSWNGGPMGNFYQTYTWDERL